VQLEEASFHINFQLATEHTRVDYLIDNIENNDPDLWAALTSIRINTNGMREDFEAAVTFLLPVCPYAKHRSTNSNKGRNAHIGAVTLKGKKHSQTRVDLCWHNKAEYAMLSKEQRSELYNWQQTKDGKDKIGREREGTQGNSNTKKQLQVKFNSLESSKLPTLEDLTACIAAPAAAPLPPPVTTPLPLYHLLWVGASPVNPYHAAAQAVQGILNDYLRRLNLQLPRGVVCSQTQMIMLF